ncbi:hypothetical protein JL722_8945 [Aureococcus anophagefferens]|nr:hypothetical protein JL722_8945 [Aureococcus anophagefferens]
MIPLEIQQALAFVASYDPSLVQSALPPPSAGSVAVDSEPGSSRPATTEPAPKPRVEWPKSAPLKAVANLQDLLAVSREAAAAKQASPPHKSGKSPKIDLDFDAVADEEDMPAELAAVATAALESGGDVFEALQEAARDLEERSATRCVEAPIAAPHGRVGGDGPAAAVKARRALLATLEKLVDGDGAIGEARRRGRRSRPRKAGMRSFAKVEAEREIRALDKLQDIHDTEENPMLDPDVRIEASYRLKMADLENAELPPDLRPKPPGAGDEKKLERRHAGVSRDKKSR